MSEEETRHTEEQPPQRKKKRYSQNSRSYRRVSDRRLEAFEEEEKARKSAGLPTQREVHAHIVEQRAKGRGGEEIALPPGTNVTEGDDIAPARAINTYASSQQVPTLSRAERKEIEPLIAEGAAKRARETTETGQFIESVPGTPVTTPIIEEPKQSESGVLLPPSESAVNRPTAEVDALTQSEPGAQSPRKRRIPTNAPIVRIPGATRQGTQVLPPLTGRRGELSRPISRVQAPRREPGPQEHEQLYIGGERVEPSQGEPMTTELSPLLKDVSPLRPKRGAYGNKPGKDKEPPLPPLPPHFGNPSRGEYGTKPVLRPTPAPSVQAPSPITAMAQAVKRGHAHPAQPPILHLGLPTTAKRARKSPPIPPPPPPPPPPMSVRGGTLPSFNRTARFGPPPGLPPVGTAPQPAGAGQPPTTQGSFAGLAPGLNEGPVQMQQVPLRGPQPVAFSGVKVSHILFAGLALIAVNFIGQIGGTNVFAKLWDFFTLAPANAHDLHSLNLPSNTFGTIFAEVALVLVLTFLAQLNSTMNLLAVGLISLFWLLWFIKNSNNLVPIWQSITSGFQKLGASPINKGPRGNPPVEPKNGSGR